MGKLLKVFALALALLLVVGLVAGCGGGEDVAGEDEPGAGGTETPTEPVTFVFGRGADADRLDPARTTNGESVKIVTNVFNGLVRFKEGSTEVEPDLAKDWTISPDGLVYTFTLRDDVKFHDGTPFNADAVVYTIERQANEEHPTHFEDMSYAGFTLEPLDKIEKVDEYTVEISLKTPYAPFLKNLAMFSNYIVNPVAVDEMGDEYAQRPIGTGPYVFESWTRDDRIVLKANDDYFRGRPAVDQIIFRVIPENAARLAELQSGNIHMMDGISPNDLQRIESDNSLVLYSMPGLNINYMRFPFNYEPYNDKRVRQGFSYAINRENIVAYLYQGAGVVAEAPIPKTMMDYTVDAYTYDPDRATALLEEAGFGDGMDITLWCYPNPRSYNPAGAKLAEAIAGDLEEVGVTSTVQTMEWTSYLAKSRSGEGFDGPSCGGWMGDNGDVDNFLFVLLHTDNNTNHYSNPEVDDLLVRAQQLLDENQRQELYQEALELIVDDAPWMFISHTTDFVAASANVKGFVQSPLSEYMFEKLELTQ